jgi:hypothetical protein
LRLERATLCPYIIAVAGALLIGVESSRLPIIIVGLATLLPLFSHVRRVGLRDAFAEPSAVTIIVAFYLFVFPLRGLVIAASGYGETFLARGGVSSSETVAVLLLASLATTALVESYYFVLGPRVSAPSRPQLSSSGLPPKGVVKLASVLVGASLLSLTGVIVQYGGVGAAQAAFLSHSTVGALQGNTSIPASGWAIFAVPATWCAACVAVSGGLPTWLRGFFALVTALIVLAAVVIYGSRLGALLALMGVWVVLYYSGWRIPTRLIIATLVLAILISEPIVSARATGPQQRLSAIERYSRIAGYDELDVALAVRREPQEIRTELMQPPRWLDLPLYFVPSVLWHGRPNLNARRLGLYVAQDLGTANDQATGFPATYITEGWLIGGWPVTLFMSILFGAFLGWTRRRLVGSATRPSPAAVLTYCFVVTLGWTYYKDGDILATVVGQTRNAIYLGLLMFATGVLGRRASPTRPWLTETTAPTSRRPPPAAARPASLPPTPPLPS